MGVSISMRPGTIARSMGELVSITPGWRSQAAAVVREVFSEFPLELTASYDLDKLRLMALAASVYTHDEDNFWKSLADGVEEHGVITVVAEY